MEPLSRRGFLRASAGAAAAALAASLPGCAHRRSGIAGRMVGAGPALGHLLRGGAPDGPPASRERAGVVVAGGGVAGLSAAWRLARGGVEDFVVLELEDDPGGTSAFGEGPVSRHPWGAHYVPVPTREQRALGELLLEAGVLRGFDSEGRGIAGEEHRCRDPEERTFEGGRWREGLFPLEDLPAAEARAEAAFLGDVQAFAARRDREGRRAFAIPVDRSSRDPDLLALDGVSFAQWLASRGYASPRLLRMADYACRDDFGCLPAHVSAWAGIHYFASRIAVPGDEPASFLTWPEGNGFLVRRLAAAAKGRIRTGAVVLELDPGSGSAPARVRYLEAATGAVREIEAHRAICALPRFAARRVVRGLDPSEPGFRTSPWVVANLFLSRPPAESGFPRAWDNVIAGSESLGYVVATHQSDAPGPASVWTWYRPFPGPDVAAARHRLLGTPWEVLRDLVLDDLLPAHPDLEECVERIDVRVWAHAMVRPEPGFLWGEARERAALPRERVHFAAADLGGLPLFEEAQWAGVRAAEEILAATGRRFESSL